MDLGRQAITIVKRTLGISDTTFKILVKKMNDENSELYEAMTRVGAKYITQGPGKGRKAFIVKEWLEA